MQPTPSHVLFEYFNSKGRVVERIALLDEKTFFASGGEFGSKPSVASQASAACATAAAHGVQALIVEVTAERLSIHAARAIRSISVNGGNRIAIADALPPLETTFGATSVQWARAIFTHLKLQPLSLQ